jgi:Na+/H+ antiporter NhaD/arsenite permease-like protein
MSEEINNLDNVIISWGKISPYFLIFLLNNHILAPYLLLRHRYVWYAVSLLAIVGAIFGTIVGSNLGACLTPVGALAGIMWADILRRERVNFDYRDFIRYGILISVPTLLVTLTLLHFIL